VVELLRDDYIPLSREPQRAYVRCITQGIATLHGRVAVIHRRAPRRLLLPFNELFTSSAYSTLTFITPTPVPNQTRLSAFLLLAQNLFPSLNVHTGVEEARRRENVSECRKLVVGLGTDGPRVDSGLFELAGTVDGSLDLIRRHRQFLPPFRLLPNRLIRLPPLPPLHLPRLCPSRG